MWTFARRFIKNKILFIAIVQFVSNVDLCPVHIICLLQTVYQPISVTVAIPPAVNGFFQKGTGPWYCINMMVFTCADCYYGINVCGLCRGVMNKHDLMEWYLCKQWNQNVTQCSNYMHCSFLCLSVVCNSYLHCGGEAGCRLFQLVLSPSAQ